MRRLYLLCINKIFPKRCNGKARQFEMLLGKWNTYNCQKKEGTKEQVAQ